MTDPYDVEIDAERRTAETEVLREFVTEQRLERMESVLDDRSRHLVPVVEDLYQPHNASAVLRSADAFGAQDVHIIENRNRYHVNPGVELGTAKWLSLYRYRDPRFHLGDPAPTDPGRGTEEAIAALRRRGYRIVATTPHRDDVDLDRFPLDRGAAAIFFGAEKEGLTDLVLDAADEYLRIPMYGFVESLNISVSAAICLQHLGARLRDSTVSWRLDPEERSIVLHRWLRRSVKHAASIIRRRLDS